MEMQQNKIRNNIHIIDSNEEKNAIDIYFTLAKMKIARIGQFFNNIKRSGVDVSDILMLLVLMPFYQLKSIPVLAKSDLRKNSGIDCGNSVFYDMKNNSQINWRSLLYLVALRFRNLSGELTAEIVNNVKAFIFDDSPIPKSGIKTEQVSRIHDHVSGDFIFGYKILVMGYWDGLSFYPLDFSLHREKGGQIDKIKKRVKTANTSLSSQRQIVKKLKKILEKTQSELKLIRKENKNKQTKTAQKKIGTATSKVKRIKKRLKIADAKYTELENKAIELRTELKETKKRQPHYGLTQKQKQEQFTKYRDATSPGAQRVEEADIKKTANMLVMLKRALRRGFRADYVLTDSWFFNTELVKLISKLYKRYKISLITMARMGTTKYKLLSNQNHYNAIELLTKFERQAKQARSHKARYIKIPVAYNEIRVNLFFIKIGQTPNWKLLVTTDLSINFQKLMDVYKIRWAIELFFRESKQYLNLGKSKSTCFDTQIADATISLLQYTILSFHQRLTNYSSFDGVFASALEDALQYGIAAELQKMFLLIVEIFSDFAGVDSMEMMGSVLRDENASNKIKFLNPVFYENIVKSKAA